LPPHDTQATPPVPHVELADVWHFWFASQQPFAHVLASQTHLPETHSWFAPHARHMLPFAPHCMVVAVTTHTPLLQQPRQLTPPQRHPPALHVAPMSHVPHALPPDPQAVVPDWAD
jgi:hypothetical protein